MKYEYMVLIESQIVGERFRFSVKVPEPDLRTIKAQLLIPKLSQFVDVIHGKQPSCPCLHFQTLE